MNEVLVAFLGAALALVGQGFFRRWQRASTGRALAMALWEELSATEFAEHGGQIVYGGFSSQVFDSLFADIAHSLPSALRRAVMRYYFKLKFIESVRRDSDPFFLDRHVADALIQWDNLRARLDNYSRRQSLELFLSWRERRMPEGNHHLRSHAMAVLANG